MNKNCKKMCRDIIITLLVLIISFFASLIVHELFNTQMLIPSVFVLAVFLISLLTDGYYFGIAAALFSMLAVNFAFTFPYFEFNFSIQENVVSALIMIVITVATSTLTTQLKRQEMLRTETEKEKMRANLLRAISHDLRTPLTAIYGASSTILENYSVLDDESKIQLIDGIKEDSQWLIRMVENLLSITKIDNSGVQLIKSPVVLEELVESSLTKFKKRYPKQEIRLVIPEAFIIVLADPILIEQVLVNILENAVQHAKGMTHLSLIVEPSEHFVCFKVIDDGCGIEKDKLREIFAGRYASNSTQVDNSKKSMGIGLSVCATIIKVHGGKIWAENLKSGGMCFGFSLEREVAEDE